VATIRQDANWLRVLGEFEGGASPFSNLSVVGQEAPGGVSMGYARGSVLWRGRLRDAHGTLAATPWASALRRSKLANEAYVGGCPVCLGRRYSEHLIDETSFQSHCL
jgi:hypothetical protein